MQEKLHDLWTSNAPFWGELTGADGRHHKWPITGTVVSEDIDDELDDSDVSPKT